MVIDPVGEECYCGKHGCLEMYTSSVAILNQVKTLMMQDRCAINSVTLPNRLQFSDAVEEMQQGNEAVTRVFQKAGAYLGLGLSNLINLFNPELIIIGGELSDCDCYVQAAKEAALSGIFLH